jgi:UMF1 family MFS transporter
MLLRLTPPDRVGEMFGLYGLVGKFSAVIGPLIYGIIVASLLSALDRGAYQVAIASLFVLLLIGIWILRGVPEDEPPARRHSWRQWTDDDRGGPPGSLDTGA